MEADLILERVDFVWVEILKILSKMEFKPTEFFYVMLFNHCICTANGLLNTWVHHKTYQARDAIPFLSSFLTYFCTTFGGGLIVAVMENKPFMFLTEDIYLLTSLTVWILALYLPFGLFQWLTDNMFIKLPLMLGDSIFIAGFLMTTADGAYEAHHTHFAPIILGFFAGTGGTYFKSILSNFFKFANPKAKGRRIPLPLVKPTFYTKMALCASVVYYLCQYKKLMEPVTYVYRDITFVVGPRHLIVVMYLATFFYLWTATVVPRLLGIFSFGKKTKEEKKPKGGKGKKKKDKKKKSGKRKTD